MRAFLGSLFLVVFVFSLAPGCKKMVQKGKELQFKQKCKKAKKYTEKCLPELAKQAKKQAMGSDDSYEKCLKAFRDDVKHRIRHVECTADSKGECDKVKECLAEAIKAEIEYRKQQKADMKADMPPGK